MRLRTLAVIALGVAAIACGGDREGVIETKGRDPITVTDDELTRYVVWWRDYVTLAHRNNIEMNAVMKRIEAKYSFAETNRIAYDPELRAALDRQRTAMQDVMNRKPVDGVKLDALNDTVPGVATLDARGDKVVYVRGRNQIALAAAHEKYGDAFVEWIVSREGLIDRLLSQ